MPTVPPRDLHAYAMERLRAVLDVERADALAATVLRDIGRDRIENADDLRAFADELATHGTIASGVAALLHTRATLLRVRTVLP